MLLCTVVVGALTVRPLAGAGIEIHQAGSQADGHQFAPSRGRELKCRCESRPGLPGVRPLAGAGIEILREFAKLILNTFAPSRGRELKSLKQICLSQCRQFAPSRGRELKLREFSFPAGKNLFAPSRGRELKYRRVERAVSGCQVRPLAGAGIEILQKFAACSRACRSPPRGGGN